MGRYDKTHSEGSLYEHIINEEKDLFKAMRKVFKFPL